jgi:hypothetical protein
MAGITPAVNPPAPQVATAPQALPAAAATATPAADPTLPQPLAAQPAAVTQQLVEVPPGTLSPVDPTLTLVTGSSPAGLPAFSPSEIMVVVSQLLQNLKSVGNPGNSVAANFLRNNGAYSISPPEEGIKVHQADENSYFQALGYDA